MLGWVVGWGVGGGGEVGRSIEKVEVDGGGIAGRGVVKGGGMDGNDGDGDNLGVYGERRGVIVGGRLT